MTPNEWAGLIDKFGVSIAVMVALFVLGSVAIGTVWLAGVKVAKWAGSRIDQFWEWHKASWERLAAGQEANAEALRLHHDQEFSRWQTFDNKLEDVHDDVRAIRMKVVP